MRIGSLFSGIGGLELGLEWAGVGTTVWQVEQNPWCRDRLAYWWPHTDRSITDVREASRDNLAPVDLICGGFPCQDVSGAGKGAGLAGSRSGLWFEFARIIDELHPSWVLVENVASGARRWIDPVMAGLGDLGYQALPFPLSASDVGAPHKRTRIFVVAWRVSDASCNPERLQQQRLPAGRAREVRDEGTAEPGDLGASMANSIDKRREEEPAPRLHASRQRGHDADRCDPDLRWIWPPRPDDQQGWKSYIARGGPQPAIRRGANGLPCGLDKREWKARLTALGNSVSPMQSQVMGYVLLELAKRLDA